MPTITENPVEFRSANLDALEVKTSRAELNFKKLEQDFLRTSEQLGALMIAVPLDVLGGTSMSIGALGLLNELQRQASILEYNGKLTNAFPGLNSLLLLLSGGAFVWQSLRLVRDSQKKKTL